jgi:ABC-2 type transport system permease protein
VTTLPDKKRRATRPANCPFGCDPVAWPTLAAPRRALSAFSLLVLLALPWTAGAQSTVGFVVGHGEPSTEGELSGVAERLRRDRRVIDVHLAADALADVDVVVLAGHPDIPDAELYQLDQFLMRGGRAAFLVDAVVVPENGTSTRISEANVFGFLATYGITVNPDIVLDDHCADGAVWGAIATSSRYVCWPVVGESGIDDSHPAVSGIRELHFPWTSSITLARSDLRDAEARVLVRSSAESWTVSGRTDVAPVPALHPPTEPKESKGGNDGFALVAALEGVIGSAFPGGRVLVQSGTRVRFTEPSGFLDTSAPTRLVVVGNSMMFRNDLAEQLPGSAEFLAGVVDWLAADAATADHSTSAEPANSRRVWTVAIVLLLGLLVIGASLAASRLVIARAAKRPPRDSDSQGGS